MMALTFIISMPGGKMIGAIRPPEAIIPAAPGQGEFFGGRDWSKGEPQSGRQNNQGFEGMSVAPGGKYLFAMTQSALMQDLDANNVKTHTAQCQVAGIRHQRARPGFIHEYAVQLPLYADGKKQSVAAQSEMLALNDHQIAAALPRQRRRLYRQTRRLGLPMRHQHDRYRRRQMISRANSIRQRQAIAPGGSLRPGIRPARLAPFLDMNDNAELGRFGLHNGPPNNSTDLYEKWESMALAPAGAPESDLFPLRGQRQ